MITNTDLPHQQDVLQQPPHAFESLKLLTFIAIVLLSALVAGTGGYLLGIKNARSNAIRQIFSSPTPLRQAPPAATPAFCPPVSPEGDPSEPYNWKTYTCRALGISFLYPA